MMLRRISAALAVAGLALAAAAGEARAGDPPQTTLTAQARITPDTGGTVKRPIGLRLDARVRFTTTGDGEKPVAQRFRILLPKQARINGGRYRTCSLGTLARSGLAGCPRTAIMGEGTATALADTVETRPTLTLVNAGARKACLWTVLTNPARVSACIVVDIERRSGRWSSQLTGTVPQNLQVVAGVPIAVQTLDLSLGRKPWARQWLSGTECPRRRRVPYHVEVDFDNGQTSTLDDVVRCRPTR